ncbi:MAG: sulfotransferase family protein [Cyclobacteriaceae bacterium]
MPLQIIGLGMGRTGTLSLKIALEKLGYGPCYHMEDLLRQPKDVIYWEEIKKRGATDWEKLFGNYRSAVDFPVVACYQPLLEKYPDAKIILTIRDENEWYESASRTIFNTEPGLGGKIKMALQMPFSPRLRMLMRVFRMSGQFWQEHVGKNFREKEAAIAFYRRWNEQIKNDLPAERLLVYEIKEGWQPLCDFLGVEVPAEEFPLANTRQQFQEGKNKIN